jgi:hypothetical protein
MACISTPEYKYDIDKVCIMVLYPFFIEIQPKKCCLGPISKVFSFPAHKNRSIEDIDFGFKPLVFPLNHV